MEIKDNVALVTGGASGLGRAAVEHIVDNGGKAAIVDINEENANDVIAQLGDENVIFINTNVMDEDSVKNALSVIEDKFSKLNFVFISLINLISIFSAFIDCSKIYLGSSLVKSNHWKPDGLIEHFSWPFGQIKIVFGKCLFQFNDNILISFPSPP